MTNEDFEVDLTPETHMLLAQASSNLGWKRCLAELVDNAFDAKATTVSIHYANKSLVIEDNGIGCTEVDAFFRQGKHRSRNGLGRFGVGLKDAALWLQGTTSVRSMTKEAGVLCSINWRKFMEHGSWKTNAQRIPTIGEPGTKISCTGIHPTNLSDAIIAELGYVFYPAIESGRQIVFRRGNKRPVPVAAFEFPPLFNIIETVSDVNGKQFRLRAGVVQDEFDNPHPGFTIAYKHRVITNTADGCGSYGTSRFVGIVQLDDQWKLSRNKDELVEDGSLLAETLHLICKDVLIHASEKSRVVTLAGIEAAIATNLREALLAHKKSKREATGAKRGTVERQDTDRKQKRGDAIQPGEKRLMKKIGSRISVQFVSGLPEIGNASFNDDGTLISLSLKHPYVEWARDHEDTNALTALAATVLAIESASITDEKQRQRLLPEIDASNQRDAFLYGLSLYTSQMSVEV